MDLWAYQLELQEAVVRFDTSMREIEVDDQRYIMCTTNSAISLQLLEPRLTEEHIAHEVYITRTQVAFQRAKGIQIFL